MATKIDSLVSIRNTYLYEMINKGGEFDKVIGTMLSKGHIADSKDLQNELATINRYYKFPLKIAVLNAFEEGIIRPMVYPEGITANNKIPTCLPFILVQSKTNHPDAVAIIDNYARYENHEIYIDTKKLYCMLEGAFIARGIQIGFNSIRHNTTMYSEAASIYAHMFSRVLNKKYALNVDKQSYAKMLFLSAKFFLIKLLQLPNSDTVFNYANKVAGDISPIALKNIDERFGDEAFQSIATFVQAIQQNGYLIINGLQTLTVREYVKQFISMYNNSALFSLEHLSYFLYNVFATVNGAYLNNQYAFDEVCGRSGGKVYGYIVNSVKNF